MRVVKDDDVDRRQVYRQRCHSRALLIARNFGRRKAGYAKGGLDAGLDKWSIGKKEDLRVCLSLEREYIESLHVSCMSALFLVVIASGFHLFPFRTEKLSPSTPMVLRKRESRSPPFFSEEKILPRPCRGRIFRVWGCLGSKQGHCRVAVESRGSLWDKVSYC